MNKSKVIRATCIFEHDEEINLTTWLYIPEEKEENKMTKTNLEHYKEDLKEIVKINFDNPRGVIKKIREIFGCQIKVERGEYATDALLEWMVQPYREPILDDAERKYLADVIRPFRNKIDTISKFQTWDGSSQYIHISMKDNHMGTLPVFPKGTMYKGMEDGKHYSLKELGL